MKRFFMLIVLSVILQIAYTQDIEQLLVSAQQAYQQGQIIKAKNLYRQATVLDNDIRAFKGLGKCYLALDNIDSAIMAFKHAYLINPADPEVNFNLGLAYFTGKGRADVAKNYFQSAMKLNPDSTKYALYLALAQQALGKIDSAFAIYSQIMQFDTTNPYPYYFLAEYMYELDSLADAYGLIQKAIEKKPDNYNFYLLKGSIEFKAKLYDLALKTAQQGLEYNPNSERLLFLKAQSLYQLQKYDPAIKILENLLLQDISNLNIYYYLGWSYYYTAQYQKAIDIATQALKQDSQIPEFYQLLAYAYIATNQFDQAQKAANKLLELNPSQIAYSLKITAALYARTPENLLTSDHKFTRFNAVNINYIKSLLSDSDGKYYYQRLKSKFDANPHKLSLDEYLMLYLGYAQNNTINRDKQQAYITEYRNGNYNACIELAQQALERYPLDQPAYLYMASAYRQLGDIANFLKYLTVFHGIQKAIIAAGEGTNPQTAYLITNRDDIYYVLDYIGANLQQSLSFGINSVKWAQYEVLKISFSFKSGMENTVYFLLFK